VNKKNFGGATTIEALVAALATKQPGWPVALDKPVLDPSAASAASPPPSVPEKAVGGETKRGKSVKKKGTVKKKAVWRHGDISRDEADALLIAADTGDGTFLVRGIEGKKFEFALGVVYKGKPTHHRIEKVEKSYVINKKSFGDCPKMAQLIAILEKAGVKGWPVPLTKPVKRTDADEEAAPAVEVAAYGARFDLLLCFGQTLMTHCCCSIDDAIGSHTCWLEATISSQHTFDPMPLPSLPLSLSRMRALSLSCCYLT
jgi:hypothetical protein